MNSKSWLRSKTVLFNLFIALVMVLSEQSELIKSVLPNEVYFDRLLLFVALCNTYLRLQTTLPVTTRKPKS